MSHSFYSFTPHREAEADRPENCLASACIKSADEEIQLYRLGWPVTFETAVLSVSELILLSFNIVVISGGIYSSVAASVIIRRKFFYQAADGSKLRNANTLDTD